MRRPYSSYGSSFSFGPGPLSPVLMAIIAANVVVFFAQMLTAAYAPGWSVTSLFGLQPDQVLTGLRVWQLATYMFLHAGIFHLLFNMLALWMFGTELERLWGTRYFLKFYFVTGIGAAVLTVLASLLPFGFTRSLFYTNIIGASGAIYGLLLAYGMYWPNRPIYMYLVFPIPARYFVMIMGALAFYASLAGGGGVANITHLGGLVVAYIFLKSGRIDPISELKYRYLKWKINRMRAKFDVYDGGRANDRVH